MRKCLVCSESRIVEEAHIVPKILFKDTQLPKYYEKLNDTILLCPTHHRLFDLGRMNKKEIGILQPYVDERLILAGKVLEACVLAEMEVSHKLKRQYRQRINRFENYFRRLARMYYG